MRVPPRPRTEWRTIAITTMDAIVFARELQSSLQELTDSGYNVIQQMQRGTGLVILASRVVQPQPTIPEGPTLPPPPPPPPLSKLRATASGAFNEDRFTYHYISPDGPKEETFTSLVEALRLVRTHVDGDGSHVPGYVIATSAATYDVPALGGLLKAYANELAVQPPKQVD